MPDNTLRPKSFFSGFGVFCKALALLAGGAAVLCVCLLTFKNLLPELQRADLPLFFGVLGGVVLLCTLMLCGTSDGWGYFALILTAAFALRLGYILMVPTVPTSDFQVLLSAAEKAAAGDYSWAAAQEGYFYIWAYQIPFVLYQSLILRISDSALAIELVNLLFMTGSCILVYAIAMPAGRRPALCAMLLYSLYPDIVQMSSVLTNQHVSVFFLLLGLLLLSRGKYVSAAFGGLFLGISQLLRPEASILLIAAGCLALWTAAESGDRGKAKRLLFTFLLMLAAYFAVTEGTELLLTRYGVAPNGIPNRTPEWKFILGLNFSSGGGYSEEYSYILTMPDQAARIAAAKEMIAATFAECESPLSFFLGKCATMWSRTVGAAWSGSGVDTSAALANGAFTVGQLQHALNVANAAIYPLIWLLALCSVPLLWKNYGGAYKYRLILTALAGYFIIYLFIEVQGRYRFCAVPLAVLMTVPFFSRIRRRKGKGGSKDEKNPENIENNA